MNRTGAEAFSHSYIRSRLETGAGIPVRPSATVRPAAATGPLRVNPANPRYFTDDSGRAILLTGSHTWYTMQDAGWSDPPPAFDYDAWLDFLEAHNHNFFRTFVWEQVKWSVGTTNDWWLSPSAYQRPGPGIALDGKPKFDVTLFNQAYFERLRERVIQAGQRGIYVSLQLFEGFSVENKPYGPGNPWPGHPLHASNNVNGIDGDPNDDDSGRETHTLQDGAITAVQEDYLRMLIDTVNDLDNVLFEICNETSGSAEEVAWQNYWIDFIHGYEAGKPKQHPVGFTVPWPNGDNQVLFASNAEWVSPNGNGGYGSDPPPADGSKVILNDTDHIWGIGGDRQWVWKSFTRGFNPIFMDPYDCTAEWSPPGCDPDNPTWVSLRLNMGYVLTYADRMNLVDMTPRAELASTGYCLANPVADGAEYLVYLPSGGTVTVDLTGSPKELTVEWLDPASGMTIDGGTVIGGGIQMLIPPFGGDAVLYVFHAAKPPVITDIEAHPFDVFARISWTTDEPATSQVSYGISPTLSISTPLSTDLVVSHTVTLDSLIPSTTYVYKVHSENASGIAAISSMQFFTSLAVEQTYPVYMPLVMRLVEIGLNPSLSVPLTR